VEILWKLCDIIVVANDMAFSARSAGLLVSRERWQSGEDAAGCLVELTKLLCVCVCVLDSQTCEMNNDDSSRLEQRSTQQ
jgi:hypothetical protein